MPSYFIYLSSVPLDCGGSILVTHDQIVHHFPRKPFSECICYEFRLVCSIALGCVFVYRDWSELLLRHLTENCSIIALALELDKKKTIYYLLECLTILVSAITRFCFPISNSAKTSPALLTSCCVRFAT